MQTKSFANDIQPSFRSRILNWRVWSFILVFGLLFGLALGYLIDSPEVSSIDWTDIADNESLQDISTLSPEQIAAMLLRNGFGPNDSELDILYAPTWYFEWNQREMPQTTDPVLVFFVLETIHEGELSEDVLLPQLLIEQQTYEPVAYLTVAEAPHHRTLQVLFEAFDESGEPLVSDGTQQLTLFVPLEGAEPRANKFTWDLPLLYGLGLVNEPTQAQTDEVALEVEEPVRMGLTWPVFFAVMGGMLAALSPCLLQLAAYYAAVLAGAGAGTQKLSEARGKVLRVGIFFVVGFTFIYTAGGVVAGFLGGSLQQLEIYNRWSRPVSIAAGVVIILLAFRVALQARAPLVCRLPIKVNSEAGSGWFSSALMGSTFAIGCLSCFSATVLSALLLYVGSIGSPVTGGLLLFLFSSGVGFIFLFASWIVSEAAPLMSWLQRSQPIIGGISALLMAAFGVLMVTYKFHIVSGFIFNLFLPK